MAGVTRLRKGRGGVDGVSPAAQHISGIQELGVGHSLRREAELYNVERAVALLLNFNSYIL